MERSAEARKVLRELDSELESASTRTGTTLVWTAADRELLTLIASSIGRRVELAAHYAEATEPKVKVKLSSELRLLEGAIARLLKQVRTDIPRPESQTTIKARRAAMRRWHPDATG